MKPEIRVRVPVASVWATKPVTKTTMSKRLRILRVNAQLFAETLMPGRRAFEVVENAIPADALVVGVAVDRDNPTIIKIAIQDDSFEPVEDGTVPPEIMPVLKKIQL